MKQRSMATRLMDSAVMSFLFTMALLHQIPFAAIWTHPFPRTQGAVWINLNPIFRILAFLSLTATFFAIRLALRWILLDRTVSRK
ncbi:MAG: hypothetical protein U0176_15985 [Bacteroidia bacterium]